MNFFRPCLVAVFFLPSVLAFAEPQTDWEQICKQAKKLELPAQDIPDAAILADLKDCNSETLYYGIGQVADYQKAKACAYKELGKEESPFQGNAILMMIYANAKGVSRDYDTAIKLACTIDGAPAETEGRIAHLQQLKQQGPGKTEFDLCDDITSGMMMGFCENHHESVEEAGRTDKLSNLTQAWGDNEKKALEILEKVADRFFEIRSTNEIDQSGTARAAMVTAEEATLKNEFLTSLSNFEKRQLPRFTNQQFIEADAKLNAVYKKVLALKKPEWGTVKKDDIKNTQREWLKFRDAWVTFGKVKYPTVSSVSWNTLWTKKRIKMLEEFLQ